jgi:murein DD-endopeptidase MepM/ murein hydrolase activator NlpD
MQKRFRLVLFSNASSSAKELNFSKIHLAVFSFVILLMFVAVTGVGVSFLSDYLYGFTIGLLQQERNFIRSSLQNMNQQYLNLDDRLEQLYSMDKELRLLIDLDEFDTALREVGIGGSNDIPASQSEFFFTEAELLSDLASVKLSKLQYLVELQEESYASILAGLEEHKEWLRFYPSGNPIDGGRISSWYGWRRNPYGPGREHHDGVDISMRRGSPVYATADGLIDLMSANDLRTGLGRYVRLNHMTDKYGWVTRYGHLSKFEPGLKKGMFIRRGQKIGEVGSSGRSTAPHLHYALQFVDPKSGVKRDLDPRLEHWNPKAFGY